MLRWFPLPRPTTTSRTGPGCGPSAAGARVLAARHHTPPGPLGSPFPLDAAFHTACAWGQRYAGVVAFPVGLDCRRVHRPTRPGDFYQAVVMPRRTTPELLVFDLALYDLDGGLCERVQGGPDAGRERRTDEAARMGSGITDYPKGKNDDNTPNSLPDGSGPASGIRHWFLRMRILARHRTSGKPVLHR